MSALLPFFPADARLYFTKGLGERFEVPSLDEGPVYLMVNEISDHLPVYSWGSHVQRIFELMAVGYALASTMHCDSTEEVIDQLTEDLAVDPALIGHLTLVLPILVDWTGSATRRRTLEVALLQPGTEGPKVTPLVKWEASEDRFAPATADGLDTLATYCGVRKKALAGDLARRTAILSDLVLQRAGHGEVEAAVTGFSANA